ncbi:MAG TPA: DUF1343 domain-containing protein [Gemmatimonadaceae bacterium]|nr:DUF1343 domain-containing protein [Gemmatimonadaceae bacterium]
MTMQRLRWPWLAPLAWGAILLCCAGASSSSSAPDSTPADTAAAAAARSGRTSAPRVRPGITVLLEDSLALLRGKRVGLLTNQTGIDARGRSDIDLLFALRDRPDAAGARLVALFSPEHGIRGDLDRAGIASGRDQRTGLPIYSLYGATVLPPPDSALKRLDVLVIDLQDLGARPWTYVASMVYAVRAAAKHTLSVIVLDRPNPITGERAEGPVIDSALTYAGSDAPGRRAKPVALSPIPLRHGLTMGELARFYNDELHLGAPLHVIPSDGWHRDMWFDQTGLPWVKPSPNMPSLASATLYPGTVIFEATNLSVGRGTPEAFQQVGAPWLDAARVVQLLESREMTGVRFEATRFAPDHPTDRKFGSVSVRGVRIVVTDRERVRVVRVAAALLWAIARTNGDSLRVDVPHFDELFGSPAARVALLRGDDPDEVMDGTLAATVAFRERTRRYWLYGSTP